jgi:bifunctional DNA-binding transcriptional regulator/antitoxin component of YhaV-PrlF toxin-antitoxin module
MRAFAVIVDGSGRILFPSKVRKQLKLQRGSELIGHSTDKLMFKTRRQALKEAQEHFSRLRRPAELWSEELIRERRREAGCERPS